MGVEQVAIFSIGLTVSSFFRSILGGLFGPFSSRFNHFIGVNDFTGLKAFYYHVTVTLAPIVVIPTLTIVLLAKPLILSWVGEDYLESVEIAQFLILVYSFSFIAYPASFLITALQRIREMYIISTLMLFIYWFGVFSTYSVLGLKSFALCKLISYIISVYCYILIIMKLLNKNYKDLIKEIFTPLLFPLSFLFISVYFLGDYLPTEKSKLNLLICIIIGSILASFTFLLLYISNLRFKEQVNKILKQTFESLIR